MKIAAVLLMIVFGFASAALAGSAKLAYKGLHSGDRILLPIDNAQEANYLVHRNVSKKKSIDAPLVTIEQVVDKDKNEKTMRVKTLIGSDGPALKME